MSTRKRILCMVLCLGLILSLLPISAMAKAPEARNVPILNYRHVEHDTAVRSDKVIDFRLNGTLFPKASTEFPVSYSSVTAGKTTSVKNQNPYGTCWAFSANAASESSMIAKGAGSYDLSDLQLAYFFYAPKIDPLGNANGDETVYLDSDSDCLLNRGGNHFFTMWSLANWTGGAPEADIPYSSENCALAKGAGLPDDWANEFDVAHLQNAYILPYSTRKQDMRDIKHAITRFGGVATSYYHDDDYMNDNTGAYYTDVASSNHAVTIVGWNDNYPASNFKKGNRPLLPGAWLVKNSWGKYSGSTDGDANVADSGDEGYFWLSYYDTSLLYVGSMFVFDFDTVGQYAHNYQYDGSAAIAAAEADRGDKLAAIYTASATETGFDERVSAVGIGFETANMSGTIYVYANVKDNEPENGDLVAQQDFVTGYEGYYTFPLEDAPVITKGTDFSVVFKLNTPGVVYVDATYNSGWIGFVDDVTNDRTYATVEGAYVDLAKEEEPCTLRIKAYTNDVPAAGTFYTVTYHADGAENVPDPQYKEENETLFLTTRTPIRKGYRFSDWVTADDAPIVIYSGGAPYDVNADLDLYARWIEEPDLATGLSVSPLVVSLEENGGSAAVRATAYPADAECDLTIPGATILGGGVYGYDGILVSVDGMSLSLRAASGTDRVVSLPVKDMRSGRTTYVLILVEQEPVVTASIGLPSEITVPKGGSKELTAVITPFDADCELSLEDAIGMGNVYTKGGYTVTFRGNKMTIRSSDFADGEVLLKVKDKNSPACAFVMVYDKDVNCAVVDTRSGRFGLRHNLAFEFRTLNADVVKVEYSTDGGRSWSENRAFTDLLLPPAIRIRATDSEGDVYNFLYLAGMVSKW